MKFSISTFLLVCGLLVVSIGWITERRTYQSRLDSTLEDAGAVSATISSAYATALIYSSKESQGGTTTLELRRSLLGDNVATLFRNLGDETEPDTRLGHYRITEDQRQQSVRLAGWSLALLDLLEIDECVEWYIEFFASRDLDYGMLFKKDEKELSPKFKQFLSDAIENYKEERNLQ